MNTRFFRNSILRARNYSCRIHRRQLTTATQPPVLLLADVHSRPAARHAVYYSLPDLKNRGFNMLMDEGKQSGNTLKDKLSREKRKIKLINEIIRLNPSLIELMQFRYQLTHDEFSEECKKELSKTSLKLKASNYETFISLMMRYDESSVLLYSQLIANNFSFQNLDEDYYPSILRPSGNRRDFDFRDEQYVNKISDAYKQGNGVICILGGLHLLPESEVSMSDCFYNKIYGKRQLIGDRLRSMGIPFIGLFPFRSDHAPAVTQVVTWQKQLYHSSPNIDPSNIYSIDTMDSLGNKRFLDAIDNLTAARKSRSVPHCHASVLFTSTS